MASEYQMSLPYPNHSLSQMTSSEAPKTRQAQAHPDGSASMADNERVSGARQKVLVVSLLIGLLFSSLDTAIVATSLITISHEMNDFVHAPWIILAYLLTYMGASGLYSLTQIGLVEIGPTHRRSLMGALVGVTLAIAFVLGPIIGGVISELSDWRWLFNMNVPCGLVTILVITSFWPQERVADLLSLSAFRSIDFLGSAMLISSSGFLVFAMQQAGSQVLAWNSPGIIISFIVSILSWLTFILWEIHLARKRHRHIEPIFPIHLMEKRVYAAGLLVTLFTGFPYICFSIILPERFQMVNSQSPLMAGVRILPMLVACACGSFLGAALSSKRNNTSYTLVGASCLQLLGVGLMTTASGDSERAIAQYGFQAIFGLGVGLSFSAATIMTNVMATEPHERAPAQGAVAQARVLGGCVGLSLCTILFNLYATQNLSGHLTDAELGMIHRSPLLGLQLPTKLRELVRTVYIEAFGLEIKVIAIACAIMVVISLFTLEKQPPSIERLTAPLKDESSSYRRGSDSGTEINDIAPQQQHTG
ncbi:hypothetical protein E4U57_002011 [Claviceps arundinis]|uniref:Major facilitator superfamily (MFS) profile domain-containing protein n=1 Tax=Claviceps arundinis TaxID=1623583 RepID=A0ABQ7PKP0_9HYPO|nr:hypothetical protein E4U57_002011 [Claviceps arundinis]